MKNTFLPLFALCLFVLPALGQKDVDVIISRARELQRNGNYAEAAAEMNKAIALDPNNTRYLFDQAEYYARAKDETNFLSRMGDTKLAQQQLKTLIETLEAKLAKTEDRNAQAEINRDLGIALGQIALVYERAGEKTLAIEALTQAMPYNRAHYLRERG